VAYRVDRAQGIVAVTVERRVTAQAVARGLDLLFADPAYDPGFSAVVDLRPAGDCVPDVDELRRIVAALRPVTRFPIHRKCALVVKSLAALSRARLLASMCTHGFVQFRAFADIGGAQAWLGMEADVGPAVRQAAVAHPLRLERLA
jgi:hypothetical protein